MKTNRTYPNLVSIEGIRGDEHHENSAHALLLPFTRFLAGMADNTFVFEKERLQRMGKTLTHQIALPIIFLNALSHLYWFDFFFFSFNLQNLNFSFFFN